jgi:hypothetical protein
MVRMHTALTLAGHAPSSLSLWMAATKAGKKATARLSHNALAKLIHSMSVQPEISLSGQNPSCQRL